MRKTPRGSEKRMKREKREKRGAENSGRMRGISKKLRRSRRKVEKLEITLLSLNAGRKSEAKKLGIYARQESRTREPDKGAGQGSRTKKQGNYLQ